VLADQKGRGFSASEPGEAASFFQSPRRIRGPQKRLSTPIRLAQTRLKSPVGACVLLMIDTGKGGCRSVTERKLSITGLCIDRGQDTRR